MATRNYVIPSEYDPADAEFTIATIDGNPYLQMGALDRDDSALFRSLIDGYVGFFLNGQRVAAVRITERYDPMKGVQLESLPQLTIGGEYHVRFTQARPGRDGANRRTGGMQPFSTDRMEGRRYGPMIPFNRYNRKRMLPYSGDPMTGKPSGDPMLGRLPKKREGAQDILHYLDGQPELVADYMWDLIMDRVPDPTGSEIVSILNALPIGSRLQYSWLDGQPSIPLNTASWHGQFQLRTAYSAGSIVTDAGNVFIYIVDIPATNTTRPAADTASRVEHLDVGNPLDITNVAKAGLTFTFTRRTGTFSLTISPTDIYNAIGNMTPTQLMGLRNLIGAAPVVHNHDDRYYTETEADSRFAPRSTISATTANVLTAILGMNETQEDQVRGKIEAIHTEGEAFTFTTTVVSSQADTAPIRNIGVTTNLRKYGSFFVGQIITSYTLLSDTRGQNLGSNVVLSISPVPTQMVIIDRSAPTSYSYTNFRGINITLTLSFTNGVSRIQLRATGNSPNRFAQVITARIYVAGVI